MVPEKCEQYHLKECFRCPKTGKTQTYATEAVLFSVVLENSVLPMG